MDLCCIKLLRLKWRGRKEWWCTHAISGSACLRCSFVLFSWPLSTFLRLVHFALFATHQRKKGVASFLPALCIGCGQVFAEDPVVGVFEHMTFDAFGIHHVIVQVWVAGLYVCRRNFGDKKSTPWHGYVPSLSIRWTIKDGKDSKAFAVLFAL